MNIKQEFKDELESITCSATYSPEDNKLRMYFSDRFSRELYEAIRDAGFKWAPKQELFVAPMWTPTRRDIALELCGSIEDESLSVEDRAHQRKDRFEQYQANRERDANCAYRTSSELADNVPMGQPILIGHHSEHKARKIANKIESSMALAVDQWDKSEYWKSRISRVFSDGQYKERDDVRLRRIKKLNTDKRRCEKTIKQYTEFYDLWNKEGIELTQKRAIAISGSSYINCSFIFSLDKYPRKEGQSEYEGSQSLYSALNDEIITPIQARDLFNDLYERVTTGTTIDWINHYNLRIMYEEECLKANGYVEPEPVKRPKPAPIINCKEANGIKFHGITKAEWKSKGRDYCGTKKVIVEGKTIFRYRHSMHIEIEGEKNSRWSLTPVYLIDSKIIEAPKKEVA